MKNKTLIAIYVNDLLLIDSNSIVIRALKKILSDRFQMFDLD
jgi:hypothetical protein